jgi:hypothetical protein
MSATLITPAIVAMMNRMPTVVAVLFGWITCRISSSLGVSLIESGS